jgi:hypothetical protein
MSESDRPNAPDRTNLRIQGRLGTVERLSRRRAGAKVSRRLINVSRRPSRILLQSSVMNWADRLDPPRRDPQDLIDT